MIAADVYLAPSVQGNFISIFSLSSWNNPERSVVLSPHFTWWESQWGSCTGTAPQSQRQEENGAWRPYCRGPSFLSPQCLQEENQRSSFASRPPPLPGSLPRVHTAQMTRIPREDEVIVSSSQGSSSRHGRTQLASQKCPVISASTTRLQALESRHLPLGYLLCLAQCWEQSEGSKCL